MKITELKCTCHGVDEGGGVYSRMRQHSRKGIQGVITTVTSKWSRLRSTKRPSGYLQISIHGKSIRVNRLVALALIQNPSAMPEVHHINGDRADNRTINLRWGNPRMNAADRATHGRTIGGEKSPNAKLTELAVLEIRKLVKTSTLQSIAEKFGVSKKLILLVKQRKIWRHL